MIQPHPCTDCGVTMASSSVYCVTCYRGRLRLCAECHDLPSQALRHKYQKHEFQPGKGQDRKSFCAVCNLKHEGRGQLTCPSCQNERWLLDTTPKQQAEAP